MPLARPMGSRFRCRQGSKFHLHCAIFLKKLRGVRQRARWPTKARGENSTLGASQDPLPATAFVPPASGNLDHWAAQGVLLLNTCLTVQDGHPASHAKQGWEVLTDALIQACAQKAEPVVFKLWGAHAQAKQALVAAQNANGRHLVLRANHPSPLSALRPPMPFLGCGHFESCHRFLQKNGQKPVVW